MTVQFQVKVTGVVRTNTRLNGIASALPVAVRKALRQEALELKKEIQKGLRTQKPGDGPALKPLSDSTRLLRKVSRRSARKAAAAKKAKQPAAQGGPTKRQQKRKRKRTGGGGRDKALIRYGFMLRSVNVTEVGGKGSLQLFVGIHRTARSKQGVKLFNVAEIHEFGTKPFAIPVTDPMRRFFRFMAAQGVFEKPISSKTTAIKHPGVPERPFLRPAKAKWDKGAEERFGRRIAVLLASTSGR